MSGRSGRGCFFGNAMRGSLASPSPGSSFAAHWPGGRRTATEPGSARGSWHKGLILRTLLRMPRDPKNSGWSGGLPASIAYFFFFEDPCTGGNKLHHFAQVLIMVVRAMLCGMDSFSGIAEFRGLRTGCLSNWLEMPDGVPRAQNFFSIIGMKAAYILALKGSQRGLRKEAQDQFHLPSAPSTSHVAWAGAALRRNWHP